MARLKRKGWKGAGVNGGSRSASATGHETAWASTKGGVRKGWYKRNECFGGDPEALLEIGKQRGMARLEGKRGGRRNEWGHPKCDSDEGMTGVG
jgi:hypothetical protein